ncbi:nuclear pore complex protein Nup107 [Macrosteles quadrilineatus]|uniref:nuclear pore complex protein Nup107 n=1 Tax=Macrosteles quadrilineatus TaxID=74068 RepID=UPI0023E217AA|nr:nuclear pore complex protein Nup107 [Macrosteles quadrilineatus]XP_054261701.1 nuclear pore complex protein Nup107 [Macrosteles quadrilineatus]
MASDDILQKSVRLLDDAVGSPMQFRSPRHSKQRSSLFNNTIQPLRHSDVRAYALNTSITMSTSELENFYMDSPSRASSALGHHTSGIQQANSTLVQQNTPISLASDSLYHSFLESLQVHSSSREVFDTIAEFALNCNNTLELMRETHDDKELQWLEFERNNWRLVQALYQNRLTSDMDGVYDGGEGDGVMDIVQPPSEKEIVENLYKTNTKIREYQLIVDWLEKNAADVADMRTGPKLHHFMDNTVAWENTLHQLQNETVAYRSTREIVKRLDPDAPLREGKPLHDLDMEDETRLLKQVLAELRCGRNDRAQALCHHCGQQWRAASLDGWRLYHDPNYATKVPTTEKLAVEGNPHRDIWKLCAWRLSENVQAGRYARAVYACLCGNLHALLPACETWDDVLWAHTRTLVDQIVEREVRNTSLREYTPMPDSYWDNKLSMENTFAVLDSSADAVVRQEARSRARVVQKLVILDQLPQLMSQMLDWASQPDCEPQMLRFLAHMVLILRQLGQPVSQEIGDQIIIIYVKVLMEQMEPVLVAHYTATLAPQDQISLYAEFLQNIDESDLRKAALQAAEQVQLPIESITQRVVENIRNEQINEVSLSLQLNDEITDEDKRKISALEWVVLYPGQRAEAIWQTNALIRTFLALGKIQAAKLAFSQVPPESIDQVLGQFQAEDDGASVMSDCLPARVSAAIQEYLSYKAYLDAQEGFADWFEHYHHARPVEPPSPGPSATFTEKVAYDHRIAAYHKDLDRWRAAMDHQTKNVKQQLYNVLLFPQGGWLADSDKEDRLRAHQIKSLRTLCLPKIVLLLHTVLHSMELFKEAIQLADLVVDERYHLYKVYSKQQMGELLSKIRESSLASLGQGRDPWSHPVMS